MLTSHPSETRRTEPLLQARNSLCQDCRLSIVDQLCAIVAERDRAKLGSIFVQMMGDLLASTHSVLYRHVTLRGKSVIVPSAVSSEIHLQPVSHAAPYAAHESRLLAKCVDSGLPTTDVIEGEHVGVVPVFRNDTIYFLIEIRRDQAFSQVEILLVQTLLNHFHDHYALIDYAETDTLTGLLNRKTFDEHLDRVLGEAALGGGEGESNINLRQRPLDDASNWLAIIDIDHFKRVNDAFGHLIGDEVLLLVAQMMQESFRSEDRLFRFGGEEFVVVLQPTDYANARQVLERFRTRIEENVFPMVGQVTVSLGFTMVREYDNPTDLIDRADKALYFAKDNGRNRVDNYETLHELGQLSAEVVRKVSDVELF